VPRYIYIEPERHRKRLRPRRKPDPGPPGVGSRCTTYTQIPPGCTPRLQWGSVVAWSSTAVTTGFVRGHRAPVTTNNRRIHQDTHRRCTRMCKRSNLPPVSRSSPASERLHPAASGCLFSFCLRLFANCLDFFFKAFIKHFNFNPRAGPFLRPLSAFLLRRLLARTGAAGQAAQQAFY
jgi:hypothetical protein